ncbi:MAG: hypothetical protein WC635_03375 [Bacteriovorax sp.]|jgi:hypothetical protein
MNEETQQNRNILYLILLVVVFMTALTFKFYREQKRQNKALQIKLITLNKTRTITPWQRLISRPQISPVVKTETTVQDQVTTQASSTIPETPANAIIQSGQPVQDLTTQELANALSLRMIEARSLDLSGLQKNIEIADEIISREPDSYSAYKAKLISLLILEGKLNQEIDDNEVNELLEIMASIDLTSDTVTRREAALISNTSNELITLENNLNEITLQREVIEEEMDLMETESPERKAYEGERQNLLNKEAEAANRITELSNTLNAGFPENQYIDEEIIQIPFLRMMAKEDYESVIDNASAFIERFPNSPDGYTFLIKAYEALGRKDDALNVIADSRLTPEIQSILQQRLQSFSNMDPKKYWERLSF